MRWFSMVMLCLVLSTTIADPDPKKYKKETAEKEKKVESLTDDERIFLREVEEKYAIKSDSPTKNKNEENVDKEHKTSMDDSQQKPSLPAVIAIEIVNDTETISKGKRTIDANLGYGYRTNNGYTYTYFGKSNLDKGKFMIYPYSQADIPASHNLNHNAKYSPQLNEKYSSPQSSNVEIQPSQAYELVPVKDDQQSYEYKKPAIPFNEHYRNGYNSGSPSSGSHSAGRGQTLYSTYNGQEFSGLSGQFPSVMSHYFVNPTQLLKNPQYKSAGLTQDHLRTQSSYLNQNQQIVPVLVLRIPSSHLNNPSAELYPDLPNNYPLSQPLNHVNLQSLVNQYFNKHGYQFAPKIMSYQNPTIAPEATPEAEPQQYSNPHVRPSYTESDYSGIQYSAVKPVMARYPNTYTDQKYSINRPQSLYQKPLQQQYEYQYMPQTEVKTQSYYIQPQYTHNTQIPEDTAYQSEEPEVNHQQTYPSVAYESQELNNQNPNEAEVHYEMPNTQQGKTETDAEQYTPQNPDPSGYSVNQENEEYQTKTVASEHGSESPYNSANYYASQQAPKSSVSVFPSRLIHTEEYEEKEQPSVSQNYVYQTQSNEDSSKSLVLSENYPSKDHTIATVLPYAYKLAKQPPQSSIQSVSYVTPVPSAKYQSQYRIMVPQTVLKNPNSEKVSYVNSHSLPMHYTQVGHYTDSRSENNYSAGSRYVSMSNKPRNYHSHPKRMVKQDNNPEMSSANHTSKKQNERTDKKSHSR